MTKYQKWHHWPWIHFLCPHLIIQLCVSPRLASTNVSPCQRASSASTLSYQTSPADLVFSSFLVYLPRQGRWTRKGRRRAVRERKIPEVWMPGCPPPSPPEKSAKEGTSCLRGIRRLIPSSVEINKRNRQLYTRGDRPHSPNPGHGILDKEAHSVQL